MLYHSSDILQFISNQDREINISRNIIYYLLFKALLNIFICVHTKGGNEQ